jgi:hypothetical protein
VADRLAAQLEDIDARLSKVESEDERRRSFWEAEGMAPASAHWHPAPETVQ